MFLIFCQFVFHFEFPSVRGNNNSNISSSCSFVQFVFHFEFSFGRGKNNSSISMLYFMLHICFKFWELLNNYSFFYSCTEMTLIKEFSSFRNDCFHNSYIFFSHRMLVEKFFFLSCVFDFLSEMELLCYSRFMVLLLAIEKKKSFISLSI